MLNNLRGRFSAFLLCRLGSLLSARGLGDSARYCFAIARTLNPGAAESLYVDARGHWDAGDHGSARSLLNALLKLDPGHARGRNLLGAIHLAAEDVTAAESLFRQAIELDPGLAAAHNNLGNIFVEQEDYRGAEPHYRAALACEPDYVEAINNLGMILNRLGRPGEAEKYCRRALQLKPQYAGALNNLGNALLNQDRRGEAIECYRSALLIQPDLPEAHLNLASALNDPEQLLGTVDHYRAVLERKPDSYMAHLRLGNALQIMGDWVGSDQHLQFAEELRPTAAEAPGIRGNNAAYLADPERAEVQYRRALLLGAGSATFSSYIFNRLYDPACRPAEFLRNAREWAIIHAESDLPCRSGDPVHVAGTRLRIGYLSKDFAVHSVSYFIEPVLAHHDRERLEIFCYSNNPKPDRATRTIENLSEHWRDIAFDSDEKAFQQIQADRIDILVELSGHTTGHRLHLLAKKPAPLQVSYLGYPATSGLRAIDYRIVDRITDPPYADAAHTETLIRLPDCFLTYQPPRDSPAVGALPAAARGYITFGSFNNPLKVNRNVVGAWARILHAVPGSRLLVKGGAFVNAAAVTRFRELFAEEGIAAERLDLLGWHPEIKKHLELYGQVDIALDPFPYNGTTTSCEALWMGVPVVSLAGDRHSARVGASLLAAVGLTELLSTSTEDYVARAVRLAADTNRLAELRADLRTRMQGSSLLDAAGFTRKLEAAYETMWHRRGDKINADKAGSNGKAIDCVTAFTLPGNLQLFLPDSLEVLPRYVLEEQGAWIPHESSFVSGLIAPGMNVIEIGTTFGVYTLALARRVGATGHVWAFEPEPGAAAALRRSCAANGFTHVEIVELEGPSGAQDRINTSRKPEIGNNAPLARKLHIGGQVKTEGWEILNAVPAPCVDHVGNANDLSRFADGTFSEIYASHVLEHLDYKDELAAALKQWNRVLRPGGKVFISVPDLQVLAKLILEKDRLSTEERFAVMRMIFGGHVDQYDYHAVGLTEEFLTGFLDAAGFVNIRRTIELGLFSDTSAMAFKGVPISLNVIAEKPPMDDVSAAANMKTAARLDAWAEDVGRPSIDFLRINAAVQDAEGICSSGRFFAAQSPLIMAEFAGCVEVESQRREIVNAFAAIGFAAWRLAPALQVLVPFTAGDAALVDIGHNSLFFCKSERAQALGAADRLVCTRSTWKIDLKASISALTDLLALPYAGTWVERWDIWMKECGIAAQDSADSRYRTALEHYAVSRDANLSRTTRWHHLSMALGLLSELAEPDAPVTMRLTYARVLYEAGLTSRANVLLATVIPRLLEGEPELIEPFVPPCARHERFAPAGATSNWLLAACFEQIEIAGSLTGYVNPASSLRRLRDIRDLGYGDAQIIERAALIVRRFDQRCPS